MNLSKEIQEIKKYNKYGMLKMSNHALFRMKEREITEEKIYEVISKKQTMIIQYHERHTYHNNDDELFVLYGKATLKDKGVPLHIVIAKKKKEYGVEYRIVTCYVPSKNLFYAHGRILRGG